jgi:hypothetical protein
MQSNHDGKLSRRWEGMKVLGKNGMISKKVSKKLCYRKAETLGDAEEPAKWWRYNLLH